VPQACPREKKEGELRAPGKMKGDLRAAGAPKAKIVRKRGENGAPEARQGKTKGEK
jgi:hypothetical protein